MAYSKQTFADGQKLTADHMNHIENGLEALDTGKLNASELSAAINTALAQAAASGNFDGADGTGISSIARTSGNGAPGTTDVYTITLTDSNSYTFTVYNGADGEDGTDGSGSTGTEELYVVTISDSGNGSLVADKSISEIGTALDTGHIVMAHRNDDGTELWLPLTVFMPGEGAAFVSNAGDSVAVIMVSSAGVEMNAIPILTAQDIPASLPNPKSLVFTGAVTGTYDGSSAVTINIPSGGGESSGADAVSISDAEIDASGHLIITLSNGNTIDAGVARGDTGASGASGNKWYTGTAITGQAAAGPVFSGSGISHAAAGDMYLNSSNYRIYECTLAGAPETAQWAYVCYIKGATGATGAAGADSISSAKINASGYLVITLSNGDTLNAGLAKGDDGYSPSVTISNVTNGKYIEIKSLDNGLERVQGFTLTNGEDGATGAAGYTPVRGTDYWTAADIATIKAYVDDAILGGSW